MWSRNTSPSASMSGYFHQPRRQTRTLNTGSLSSADEWIWAAARTRSPQRATMRSMSTAMMVRELLTTSLTMTTSSSGGGDQDDEDFTRKILSRRQCVIQDPVEFQQIINERKGKTSFLFYFLLLKFSSRVQLLLLLLLLVLMLLLLLLFFLLLCFWVRWNSIKSIDFFFFSAEISFSSTRFSSFYLPCIFQKLCQRRRWYNNNILL